MQSGQMTAKFETMLKNYLKQEEKKDPQVRQKEQEKRKKKKELRKEQKKKEKDKGELAQSGKTKKAGKNLRDKRLASAMNNEETWRSWLERNMNTEKEKEEFIQEHLKEKETFIDLDQRIGETNADFRARKLKEKA